MSGEATRAILYEQRFSLFGFTPTIVMSVAALKRPARKRKSGEDLRKERWAVDHTRLCSAYNTAQIAAGFALEALSFDGGKQQRVLQIGMGAGMATGYLAQMPVSLNIDVVELEPAVYEAAKKWFAFPSTPNVKVHIADGVVFAMEAAARGEKYDSILLDASSNDQDDALICPHESFLQTEVIAAMSELMGSTGVLTVNLMSTKNRDRLELEITEKFSVLFETCFILRADESQSILVCSNRQETDWRNQRESILKNFATFDGIMGTELARSIDLLNPAIA